MPRHTVLPYFHMPRQEVIDGDDPPLTYHANAGQESDQTLKCPISPLCVSGRVAGPN